MKIPNWAERNNSKDFVITILLFVAAIGLLSFEWQNGIGGGVSTVGAERVLAGEIPYRDFWTMYAPGHFYLSALLFRIFGSHILVDWISATVITAASSCVCYLLVRTFGGRLAGIAVAVVFLSAMYNTGYFKHLGTYPASSLLIFTQLIFVARYFKSASRTELFWAGLLMGAAIIFKHDVGGYTAIATAAGLTAYTLCSRTTTFVRPLMTELFTNVLYYSAGCLIIVIPVLIYFVVLAGPDMLQDLVIFPLTDFPFSRPESYPSLWPSGVFKAAGISKLIRESANYLSFALPFFCFFLGVAAIIVAFRRRMAEYAGSAVLLCILITFHYAAAHVQINTHIISISVYGALLGGIFHRVVIIERGTDISRFARILVATFAMMWILSLAIPPLYQRWQDRRSEMAVLDLPKVSGTKLSAEEARQLSELWNFVHAQTSPGEHIYVGLHRHDVLLIGDYMLYFILNRPGATRYDELHPAITDTSLIQREMIGDLRQKNVWVIVLEHIFSDDKLDEIRQDFQQNLPNIGATDLDEFIHGNYSKVQQYGRYEVWLRKVNGSNHPTSED